MNGSYGSGSGNCGEYGNEGGGLRLTFALVDAVGWDISQDKTGQAPARRGDGERKTDAPNVQDVYE